MIFLKLVDYSDKYSIYFSNPKTWVLWAIIDLHDYLMFFLINIFIVVIVFLYYCLKYRYKYLHIASKDLPDYVEYKLEDANHAPYLEFFWTMIPIGLLFLMGWPSFKVLYAMEQLIDPFHTIIIIGNQWYRTYQYSDFDVTFDMIFQLDSDLFYEYKKDAIKNVSTDSFLISKAGIKQYVNFNQFIQLIGKHFRNYEESQIVYDSVIIPEENLPLGYPRLLSVDQVLVLPCNVSIRLLITSADVIHSWALPSHGIKMDAIPGRINQVPFLCNFWGTYWGQCSELCGINHGFMPIEVRVLPFKDYMLYLNLNLAFRYEKFQPMLVKFFQAYVDHLKYNAEKDLYENFNEIVFDDKIEINSEKLNEINTGSIIEENKPIENVINSPIEEAKLVEKENSIIEENKVVENPSIEENKSFVNSIIEENKPIENVINSPIEEAKLVEKENSIIEENKPIVNSNNPSMSKYFIDGKFCESMSEEFNNEFSLSDPLDDEKIANLILEEMNPTKFRDNDICDDCYRTEEQLKEEARQRRWENFCWKEKGQAEGLFVAAAMIMIYFSVNHFMRLP